MIAPARVLLLGVVAFVLALAAGARAQSAAVAPKHVAVHVEGLDAKKLRDDVTGAIPPELAVVEAEAFAKALVKAGQRGDLGFAISNAAQRKRILERVRKAAEAVQADAVVVARVRASKMGGREAWVLVVRPTTDNVAVDRAVPLAKDASERRAALRDAIEPALADLIPPPPPPPPEPVAGSPTTEEPPEDDQAKTERAPHDVSTEIVEVGLAFALGGRFFDYNDRITQNLRSYDVFGAPSLALRGEAYPLTTTGIPVLRDLGLTVAFATAIGLRSETTDGTAIGSSWTRFAAGLRARIRTDDAPSATVGLSGRFGLVRFAFDDDTPIADELPDVAYTYLRAGLDARVPFGRVAIGVHGGYLGMLSSGDVLDRFRDPSVGGVDVGGTLGVSIVSGLEARLFGEYTRMFYAFSPEPGDPYVAGGALDEMLAFELGLAYVY